MRFNNNNGTLDLVPMTLNIVNLQGLRLICRKNSERYDRKTSKQRGKKQKIQPSELKHRQFRSNKIYFKKKKEKDEEIYFSDYRIKYGAEIPYLINHNTSVNNVEDSNPTKKTDSVSNNEEEKHKLIYLNPVRNDTSLDKQLQQFVSRKNERSIQRESEKSKQKRHASTKMERRRTPNMIKVSFSHKNYKKVHTADPKTGMGDTDHKLDGWAIVQSPAICEIDKRLDITSYGEPDMEEARNYFSERKKSREQNRYFTKIKKPKLLFKN